MTETHDTSSAQSHDGQATATGSPLGGLVNGNELGRAGEASSKSVRATADFSSRALVVVASDDEEEIPPVPPGIGVRGGALWEELQEAQTFDAKETNLLIEVCRILDTIDALSQSIESDGVMLIGSQGQQVLNAAVGELRQQQHSFARLVTILNLDGSQSASEILTATSAKARTAANARWSSQRRAHA